ncbi:MAG: glycosyltransferase 87 family protein [Acidimicrobiia bacterium]
MTSLLPGKPFALMVRVVVASLVVLVWWYAAKSQDPARSDATADWILVKAVSSQLSPFEDVRVLGNQLGVPFKSWRDMSEPIVAYRTPGGLLLLYPLILVDWSAAHVLVSLVGMLCFLWMLLVQIPRYCHVPVEKLLLPLALASVSATSIETTNWGAVSSIIAVLTLGTLLRVGNVTSGVPLAIATVMKLYPGLLFVPMLVKRQRSLLLGIVVVVAISTALGAVTFGLSLGETARLMMEGSSVWLTSGGNVSVGAMLTGPSAPFWIFPLLVLIGIAIVAKYAMVRPLAQALAFAIPVSVLVNPVSWVHYDVLLIPVVIWLWTRSRYSFGRYVAITWLAFQAIASRLSDLGAVDVVRVGVFGSRILVAAAIAFAPAALWKPPEPARAFQLTS